MTQPTETVSQRADQAARDLITNIGFAAQRFDDFRQAFARFERELSTNKDETIVKLREALEPFAEFSHRKVRISLSPDDPIVRRAAWLIAALTSTKKEG